MTRDTFLFYKVLIVFRPMSITVTWDEVNTIEGRLFADDALSIRAADHSWKAMGMAMGDRVSWGAIRSACMAFI